MTHPLIELARQTIEGLFSQKQATMPTGYDEPQGCFVTINKNNELRGCIGYVTTDKPLKETVVEAAKAAAKNDPRFPPLSKEELRDITIEVSVLSRPKKILSEDPAKRQQAFTPGETGLIVQRGWLSGLLLPQVFDENTTAQEALDMTCKKAGLLRNAWKEPSTSIYTFTATVHEE
ncbi:AmmeMemoRadiSam system protein A [Candidatus Woesearchaeota archaeon]|nr:AmmeMemoRadiSam system protein A [Candidatus Woesearchaeota archaeon]